MEEKRPLVRGVRADFDLLVDFLLERGNRLRKDAEGQEIRWRNDKEGEHVYLQNPIDFDALQEHFRFASDVRLVCESHSQFIEGQTGWVTIEWDRAASLRSVYEP